MAEVERFFFLDRVRAVLRGARLNFSRGQSLMHMRMQVGEHISDRSFLERN